MMCSLLLYLEPPFWRLSNIRLQGFPQQQSLQRRRMCPSLESTAAMNCSFRSWYVLGFSTTLPGCKQHC